MDKKTKEMLFNLIKAMVSANVKKESPKKAEPEEAKDTGTGRVVRTIRRKKLPQNSH